MKLDNELLLRGSDLSFSRGGQLLLDKVEIAIHRDEIITVIGPNGAGKTTLVRILLGLLSPSLGKVIAEPGLRIGYVPQRMQVDPVLPLSVERFLRTGGHFTHQEMMQALQEVGAERVLDCPVHQVSGGELQRILLARAILRKPDLLILDEPTQGVDLGGQAELYRLISHLRDRYHCGVLMVSHDLHLVMEASDSVMCLNQHVCCSGRPEAISQHPEYLKLIGDSVGPGLAVYSHEHDHCHDIHGNIHSLDSSEEETHG
jgi:zinc transport system ATP-binding protein